MRYNADEELIQVMPLAIPLTFFLVTPRPDALSSLSLPAEYGNESLGVPSTVPYSAIPTEDVDDDHDSSMSNVRTEKSFALSASDKWRLVKPLLLKYMLPLCTFQRACATYHEC